jgi:hypothetical protein
MKDSQEMDIFASSIEDELETAIVQNDSDDVKEAKKQDRWLEKRVGKITASIMPKLMTKGKGKDWGDTSRKELLAIFHERKTKIKRDGLNTWAMRWGNDNEYEAFCYYRDHHEPTAKYGKDGDDIMFLEPIEGFGISPDAMVGDYGIVEIKNPEQGSVHLEYCLIESIKKGDDYFYQMMAQFLSGVDWIDFCSFDPRMPDGDELKMHRVRLLRDNYLDEIEEVRQRVIKANELLSDFNLLKSL